LAIVHSLALICVRWHSSRAGEMIVPQQREDAPDNQDSSPEGFCRAPDSWA